MNKVFARGNIYLANLNPSRGAEVGKIRPILIVQSNTINKTHDTVIVLPLTTRLIDNSSLHFRINKQDDLFKDSDVLCLHLRTLDIRKIISNRLTELSRYEMQQIEEKLEWILGFND